MALCNNQAVLEKAEELEEEMAEYGLTWQNQEQILDQIESELHEVRVELHSEADQKALQSEIGDLLHAVLTLCVFRRFDPTKTLEQAVLKVERRFHAVKRIAENEGLTDLKGKSFEEMMRLWDQAKKMVG